MAVAYPVFALFGHQVPAASATKKPDIYYIIFDEFAGSDSVRNYWRDGSGDSFEAFLEQKGFFVASGSNSRTLNTGSEIASRLNLQHYGEYLSGETKEQAINHSKVMRVLKANGYTTVAIDMYFQNIQADINVTYDPKSINALASAPFPKTFLDGTLPEAYQRYASSNNPLAVQQREQILYSLEKTLHPGPIGSPKFVYTHILLPHEPFIFDADGKLLPPEAHDNWDYYLGQLQYTTQLAERLVNQLLAQADPQNPPVIILQSDHGARNIPSIGPGGKLLNNLLKNYSLVYAHDILNALYLPGYNTSALSDAMDPNETFEIVLNFYLKAGLEVIDAPAQEIENPSHFSAAAPD